MTLGQIVAFADVAAAVLSAAALVLGFYVHAVASAKIEKSRELTETKLEAKIEAVGKELHRASELASSRLHERISGYETRVRNLEIRIDGNAKSEDLHQVALRIAEMGGDLKGVLARMEAMEQTSRNNAGALKRVEDHIFAVQGV